MDDFQKKALTANLLYLQDNLVLSEELYAALLQYKVFSDETIEAIQYERSTKAKISAFVKSLKKCNNGKLDTVLYILAQVGQSHIVEKLQMTEKVQRNDSANKKIKDKLKTFMHDKFIQNKHFSSIEFNFILDNLVLKEDFHEGKVQKEIALMENRELQYANLEKDRKTADLDLKLQLSLAENKQNRALIGKYEKEVNMLKADVENLECELRHQKSLLVEAAQQNSSSDNSFSESDDDEVQLMKIQDLVMSSSDDDDDVNVMKLHDYRDGTAVEDVDDEEQENDKNTLTALKNVMMDKEYRMGVLNEQITQLLKSAGFTTTSANTEQSDTLQDLDQNIQSLKTLCRDGVFLPQGSLPAPDIFQADAKVEEAAQNDMDQQVIEKLQTKLHQTRHERNKFKHDLSNLQRQLGNIGLKLEKERLKVQNIERNLRSRESTSVSHAQLSMKAVDRPGGVPFKHKPQRSQAHVTRSCIFPEVHQDRNLTTDKQQGDKKDLPLKQVRIQFNK